LRLKVRGASRGYRGSVEGVRSVRESSEQRGHERGGLGERNGNDELGFDQNVKKGRGGVYLRPRYRQANALRKLAVSTAPSGRRIWVGGLSLVHERRGKGELGRELYRASRGTEGANARAIKPGIKAA